MVYQRPSRSVRISVWYLYDFVYFVSAEDRPIKCPHSNSVSMSYQSEECSVDRLSSYLIDRTTALSAPLTSVSSPCCPASAMPSCDLGVAFPLRSTRVVRCEPDSALDDAFVPIECLLDFILPLPNFLLLQPSPFLLITRNIILFAIPIHEPTDVSVVDRDTDHGVFLLALPVVDDAMAIDAQAFAPMAAPCNNALVHLPVSNACPLVDVGPPANILAPGPRCSKPKSEALNSVWASISRSIGVDRRRRGETRHCTGNHC
ncbi:hypothetical protein BD779DRAFT_1241627 [Infundibulicybe gibba]|nr:hypothetical protein BD779DRAFT_1241627 [Infundibulicybe gibba]